MLNKFLDDSNQSEQSEQFDQTDYSDFQTPSNQIFNLEDALKGFPVITRKGSEVKIISYNETKQTLIARIFHEDGEVTEEEFQNNGMYHNKLSMGDLIMAQRTYSAYYDVYKKENENNVELFFGPPGFTEKAPNLPEGYEYLYTEPRETPIKDKALYEKTCKDLMNYNIKII